MARPKRSATPAPSSEGDGAVPRREIVGYVLAAVGAAVMIVVPTVVLQGSSPPATLEGIVGLVEIAGGALMVFGLTRAERAFRPARPTRPSPTRSEPERGRRRSWTIWAVGLVVFLGGVVLTTTSDALLGLGMVLAGLALFVYSLLLYVRALRLERAGGAPLGPA